MSASQINVLALSRNGRRMVGTVITCVRSAKFVFKLIDETSLEVPHIAVVDEDDAQMRIQLDTARERSPQIVVIHLVRAFSTSAASRHELLGIQLISHLMPMLERVAVTIAPAASEPAPAARSNVLQLAVAPRRERLRALVVDDSPTVRTQLARTLDRMGMDCDAADGGNTALSLLTQHTYNIIYVDVVMPDMDGYKLTREIKRDRENKVTPVIILTSKSSPFDRARGSLAGCDTYLTKPVELKRFYEATVMCLAKNMAVADMRGLVIDPTAASVRAEAATGVATRPQSSASYGSPSGFPTGTK
jgi:two-component system, cell cycle response regulator